MKKGTPAYGLIIGCAFVVFGILLLTIGFWKTLLLSVLFAVGFFIGTVEDKEKFIKDTANRILPGKESEPVDFSTGLTKEQMELAEEIRNRNNSQKQPAAAQQAAAPAVTGEAPESDPVPVAEEPLNINNDGE